jgi:hypothetical protein
MCTEIEITSDDKPMAISMDSGEKNCCVCGEKEYLNTEYTKCPSDHNICKTCYLSVLQMCYCQNQLGDVVYKCPLCRNEHRMNNKQMNNIILNLMGIDNMCLKVHKLCENKNITKKCQFEKCGCRTNVVDIIAENEMDLAIKDIIYVADKYFKDKIPLD